VNFLGVGLHNYGFTAGKNTIWVFYFVMMLFLLYGFMAMLLEKFLAAQKSPEPVENKPLTESQVS